MASSKKTARTAEPTVETAAPVTPEVPMLELPDRKIPIADLAPEVQELVDIYKGWLAERQEALARVQQAEVELVKLRRNAFVYEAAMKSISEEIMKRVEAADVVAANSPAVAEA